MSESDVVPQQQDGRHLTGRRRTRRWTGIGYTDAEWNAIRTGAEACGKPVRRFIRETSLGAVPKMLPGRADAALVRELGRSAMALARLAAVARASGALPNATSLEAALTEVLAIVRRIVPRHTHGKPQNAERPE